MQSNHLTKKQRNLLTALHSGATIMILPVDKGRATVIMDKTNSFQKANTLLNDSESYRSSSANHLTTPTNQSNKQLDRPRLQMKLQPNDLWDAVISRVCGVPKTHKSYVPLRTIAFFAWLPYFWSAKIGHIQTLAPNTAIYDLREISWRSY